MENKDQAEFNLTNENYFSDNVRKRFLSVSLFKEFMKCEVMALALINGEIQEKPTDALLVGSYVDAYFSNELDDFVAKHPELFTKSGSLLAKYKIAEDVIKSIENDELMSKYLNGQKQVIMTGKIANTPWKIKMDAYHPGKLIVDQKIMKDMSDTWIVENGRNIKTDFVYAYRYDIQGAVYQEIESQNSATHEKLPFVLAVTTKEEVPDKQLIKIDQEYLDLALEEVKAKAPRYWGIIKGEIEPIGCGHCPACRMKKKITGVMSYKQLFKEKEE